MSIEKMYENANIKICKRKQGFTLKDCTDRNCRECGYYDIPQFTAEKQLSLIKWLLGGYDIGFNQLGERCINTSLDGVNCIGGLGSGDTFEESLAQAINDIWQDLTEEERKQIKEILE